MIIIQSPEQMQQLMQTMRTSGKTIAFVPTMGFLHEGHLSLLREGRERGDVLVLSIFVNPTQFGQGEDFETYPRDLDQDCGLARECGVDYIFAPTARQMYPHGYATEVNVTGISEGLCGASRPTHFKGVCTVVAKLFNIIQPHVALFGTKDFQQLAVVRRMTQDLNLPVEIAGMPIYREADGLAMSSRNVYLTPEQRQQGLALSQGLTMARELVITGERDCVRIIEQVRQLLATRPEIRIDYVSICHQLTLKEQTQVDADSVLLLAVFVGQTRLIDNGYLMDAA